VSLPDCKATPVPVGSPGFGAFLSKKSRLRNVQGALNMLTIRYVAALSVELSAVLGQDTNLSTLVVAGGQAQRGHREGT
jgi:hypothetical protein